MEKIRSRDEHPNLFFRALFLGLKILKFFDANPDLGSPTLEPPESKVGYRENKKF
jgi:hypothetical protein